MRLANQIVRSVLLVNIARTQLAVDYLVQLDYTVLGMHLFVLHVLQVTGMQIENVLLILLGVIFVFTKEKVRLFFSI